MFKNDRFWFFCTNFEKNFQNIKKCLKNENDEILIFLLDKRRLSIRLLKFDFKKFDTFQPE